MFFLDTVYFLDCTPSYLSLVDLATVQRLYYMHHFKNSRPILGMLTV